MKNINIAIDGPAGAGKSTIAKIVAKELGFLYIDTGAMYRAVGLFAINQKFDVKNNKKDLIFCLKRIKIELVHSNDGQQILLNGENVTGQLRREDVSMAASAVAVIPEVREMLVTIQQRIASENSVLMDGRDIGTVVLPNADLKIFLTASVQDRAKRRYEELCEKGVPCEYEEIIRDIETRDHTDSTREASPLRRAEDAVLLDTSGNTLEQSVAAVKKLIGECLKKSNP